jgi:predicted dienelactone hydrolase
MRAFVLAMLLVPLIASAAPDRCGNSATPSAAFAAPGSHAVAQRTYTFVDTSRVTPPNKTYPGAPQRTLVTEVWYPTGSPSGALLGDAPYPLVVHSHGYLDNRLGEAYATRHLASHGYVVVAIDYPLSTSLAPGGPTIDDTANQPGDASFVIDRILEKASTPGDELFGLVDAEHIGASGLSLGGLTTMLLTYHRELRDPRIDAALPMAAPSCFFTKKFFRTSDAPLLIMLGTTDALVPIAENGQRSWRNAHRKKYFVTLENGSHTGFSGFASLFDQSQHFDKIGCSALLAGLGDALNDPNLFAGLGTKRDGVNAAPDRCPLPCTDTPVDPSMGAERHHELVRIVLTAFFDAYHKGDAGARCALDKGIDAEQGDLDVRSR